jgi:hypothetical protein
MKQLKFLLNFLAFLLTIIMVLYGFLTGFDTFELLTNILYFAVMIIVTLIDLFEQIQKGCNL